jgi:hypothetical protein
LIIETKNATVETSIPEGMGESREMKVSEAGMIHIVGMLTNAYKDPETAVIRENFTNGVDAHVRAGVRHLPVMVTLPTWDKPNYVVTDNGCGMSKADLLDVYGQYGESSKLSTNEEAGGFGIGAKSGLAISSQFTVVSVKDGIKSVALITKDSGLPKINVLSSNPTDEPNGTIVSIPVKDVYEFRSKARDFFSYVDPASVLVDGEHPKYALDDATEVSHPDDPAFKAYVKMTGRSWGVGGSYLIMGNVPYSISEEDLSIAMGKTFNSDVNRHIMAMTKYFMAPIGSVDLTLNREGLMYTDKTKDLIKDNMTKLSEAIKTTAQAEADAAEDFYSYFQIKRKWKNQCGWNLSYKGKEWTDSVNLSQSGRKIKRTTNGTSNSNDLINKFYYDSYDKSYLVTGLTGDDYAKINNSLTPFLRGRKEVEGVFILTEATEHLTDERTKGNKMIEIISFEDIIEGAKAQRKLDRANAVKANKTEPEKLKYPVLLINEDKIEWIAYNEIPEGSPYASQDQSSEYLARVIAAIYEKSSYNATTYVQKVCTALKNLTDYTHIVLVGGARTSDAFLKRVPGSPDLNKILEDKVVTEYKTLLTDEIKSYASYKNSNWSTLFKKLGTNLTDQIKDDRLKSIASAASHTKDTIKKLSEMRSHLGSVKYFYHSDLPSVNDIRENETIIELNDTYPMISALKYELGNVPGEHIIAYINAVQSLNA